MFERFSDRARKVMALANRQSQQLNHEYIGPEHMLLGLLEEGTGVGLTVLKTLDLDLEQARAKVLNVLKAGPDMVTIGKAPLNPRAKKVIEYAILEARGLGHHYVGTEHLLLGLVRERQGIPALVFEDLGVREDNVRPLVIELTAAPSKEAAAEEPVSPMNATVARSEQESVRLALTEAARMSLMQGSGFPGTYHLLIALFNDKSCIAARVLAGLELTPELVRQKVMEEIERLNKPGDPPANQ